VVGPLACSDSARTGALLAWRLANAPVLRDSRSRCPTSPATPPCGSGVCRFGERGCWVGLRRRPAGGGPDSPSYAYAIRPRLAACRGWAVLSAIGVPNPAQAAQPAARGGVCAGSARPRLLLPRSGRAERRPSAHGRFHPRLGRIHRDMRVESGPGAPAGRRRWSNTFLFSADESVFAGPVPIGAPAGRRRWRVRPLRAAAPAPPSEWTRRKAPRPAAGSGAYADANLRLARAYAGAHRPRVGTILWELSAPRARAPALSPRSGVPTR
jgi:hypothetical protein